MGVREAFDWQSCFRFRRLDYLKESLGGPCHAIVSALSIHHASQAEKAELFRRVLGALAPGAHAGDRRPRSSASR
jgi:hypothetical protein